MREGGANPAWGHSFLGATAVYAALVGGSTAQAQAINRFSGDVVLTEGYSTNPFLANGNDTKSVFAELSFSPQYLLQQPGAITSLSANYRRTQYLATDDSSQGYGASAQHMRQLDPRTTLMLGIDYNSFIAGERRPLFVNPIDAFPEEPNAPNLPGEPTAPPENQNPDLGTIGEPAPGDIIDPTLIGSRARTSMLGFRGAMSTRLSAFDIVSVSLSASRAFQNARVASDYRSYGGSASYSRTLSVRSTAGVRISVNQTDYLGPIGADSAIIQPQLTYSTQLTPSIRVNGALGALFIKSRGRQDSPSVSGELEACHTSVRDSLCISAARAAIATGLGSIRKQLSAGLNYSYRLGAYDNIGASASYARFSGIDGIASSGDNLSTSVFWSTRLNDRLSGGVSLSFRDRSGIASSSSADFNGQVYIGLRLGSLR